MKTYKALFNVLLVTLLVWTFQSATMHFHQHTLHEMPDCTACNVSKQLHSTKQNSASFLLNDFIAVQSSAEAENACAKSVFDYTNVRIGRPLRIVQYSLEGVLATDAGYQATAPPYFFS